MNSKCSKLLTSLFFQIAFLLVVQMSTERVEAANVTMMTPMVINNIVTAYIELDGEITLGDEMKIRDKISIAKDMAKNRKIDYFLKLNSGGGNVLTAFNIAETLKLYKFDTGVGDVCASACVIPFFAGRDKLAVACNRIGLHRASLDNDENKATFSISTKIADFMAENGVPWSVIKKMLMTESEAIYWLSVDDMVDAKINVDFETSKIACKNQKN